MRDRIEADGKLIAEMREALTATCAALAASISLLEKGGRAAKKAAASDTMFNMMLNDYRRALSDARAILARLDAEAQPLQPHKYVPDPNPQMMGDCAVCGHIRSAAIHDAEAQR
jgi:hypothetical protein